VQDGALSDQQVVQAVQKDGLQLPYMRGWLGLDLMQYQTYFWKFWKPFKNAKLVGQSNTGANGDSQSCADSGLDSAQAGTGEGNTPRNAYQSMRSANRCSMTLLTV
jgi:hypothetical protein